MSTTNGPYIDSHHHSDNSLWLPLSGSAFSEAASRFPLGFETKFLPTSVVITAGLVTDKQAHRTRAHSGCTRPQTWRKLRTFEKTS
jgi:hypothetical protein